MHLYFSIRRPARLLSRHTSGEDSLLPGTSNFSESTRDDCWSEQTLADDMTTELRRCLKNHEHKLHWVTSQPDS